MYNDLVSIVVPVYNVEKYLNRCINSIVNQTYQNLEILLIDDGSTDNSSKMCDEWANKDSRIRVIHKQNCGQGMARNTGIDCANGNYICFFDSDDYVDVHTIERAYILAKQENADTVIYGMASVDAQGNVVDKKPIVMPQTVFEGTEIQEMLLPEMLGINLDTGIHSGLSMSACRELFSAELIRRAGFRFVSERDIISEDYYSLLGLYKDVRKTVILNEVLYYYCNNPASFSHSYRPDRFDMLKSFYQASVMQCENLHYSKEIVRRCSVPFLNSVILTLKQEVSYNRYIANSIVRVKGVVGDAVLQNVLQQNKNDRINIQKKLLFWAMRHKCYLLCYLLLVIKIHGSK